MKVFCTGISGTSKKEYLKRMEKEANKKHGANYVKVYHMGDMMFDVYEKRFNEKIPRDNILNVREDKRKAAISLAFEGAMESASKYKHQIFNSHEWFFCDKIYSTANNGYDLTKINPDMFVTFISQSEQIQKSLMSKQRWKPQKLSLDEILQWQNIEVEGTAKSAEFFKKDHYIFASTEPESVLSDLIKTPRKEIVYASFPMTHLKTATGRKKIDKFVSNLREYFIVFDPRSIEVTEASTKTMKEQTVRRDLIWYISKVDKLVNLYVGKLVYTAGVVSEVKEAYETGKDTWVIGLKSKGPFEEKFMTKKFASSNKFFKFLKEDYFKNRPIEWVKHSP